MTKIHISDQTHTVTVDHDGAELADVVETARKLWDDTRPALPGAGPAFGYSLDREPTRGGFNWRLGEGGRPLNIT